MRVVVDTIPERGLEVPLDLNTAWALEAAAEALERSPQTLGGRLSLKLVGDHVLVAGTLKASFAATCDRCLAKVTVDLQGEVDLSYGPAGAQVLEEDERELLPDELDAGWYQDGALVLADVVSEQLALWLSERVTCGDDGVSRLDPGTCALPGQDEGPDLKTHRPFANLRLPE